MGKINMKGVILGGLLAGLVMNVGEYVLNEIILGEAWAAAMQNLNMPAIGGGAVVVFLIMGFVLGVLMIYLYAGIRPRFGPGPKTALCAGLLGWSMAYLYPTVGMAVMGMFPTGMLVWSLIWGVIELPLAAVIGAWAYHEQE